jgi:Icc-related predicted phosphoesterase
LFVADLHGHPDRYEKLYGAIAEEEPRAVFLGGDLLPGLLAGMTAPERSPSNFVQQFLVERLLQLQETMGAAYPEIFVILGNDDGGSVEPAMLEAQQHGIWHYAHDRRIDCCGFSVHGYSYVPPTPFMLKDWERYDVSRHVDPGCVSPEDGHHSVPVMPRDLRYSTIKEDLDRLTQGHDVERAVFLFHSPPYQTKLDRAALDGKSIDHAPLDVHVGSIAIRRFIEERQPWLCLHGHVHESARLTGSWSDRIGRTLLLGAAHDGPELALVRFDLEQPGTASRHLL